MDLTKNDNTFCMENPMNTYVSKENKLHMQFETLSNETSQPLAFEAGYFGYKHVYNQSEQNSIVISFADIIPAHITDKLFNFTTSFEIKIQVPQVDMYFIPKFFNCTLAIQQGKIIILADNGKS